MDIILSEYQATFLSQDELTMEIGAFLWRALDAQKGYLRVDEPSFRNNQQWGLTPQGWVGFIPLANGQRLVLQPKVALTNLFEMLEYAYELGSFNLMANGVTAVSTLDGFYERLAHILANRVMKRVKQGLHRHYQAEQNQLPYVRGKLLTTWPQPTQTAVSCQYDQFTTDIPDNQILAYTLRQIAFSHVCKEDVQTAVRRAYRALRSNITDQPFAIREIINRFYSRLNQDYEPMHALCRFFLEHSGPSHQIGNANMIPFLVNMANLFEKFVSQWLKLHLPPPYRLKVQEKINFGHNNELRFEIDLVIEDTEGNTRYVLDTKYKTPDKPDNADINQIIAYATAKGCIEAILIYPTPLPQPLDLYLDNIHIRTLTFSLAENLEDAGQQFINELFTTNIQKAQ